MALQPPPKRHDWSFVGSTLEGPAGTSPTIIAVCRDCGLVRVEIARLRTEVHLELSGACPS